MQQVAIHNAKNINWIKDQRGALVLKKLIFICTNVAEIHEEYGKQD